MKKNFFKLFFVIAITCTSLTSCFYNDDSSSNEDNPYVQGFIVDPNNFEGEINKDVSITLDASKTYYLTGKLQINDGGSLTIPAGTKIIATGGTSAFVAVAQGGKLFALGTKEKPVVFTSANAKPGDWGGVVLCGRAPINVAKSATAEVSELTYGGDIVNDNSGVLRYTRIEYAGAIYNSEKEFNGLSLFGVGNGTTIEYLQVYAGSDDGIEFFGGTVNTKYIVSSENEDDQFDWTEGWNGLNEYWFTKEGRNKGNRGIEADNNSAQHSRTPISNPTIKNVTLVGLGKDYVGEGENQALKLRVGTKAKIENIVIANWKTGIDIEHDQTLSWIPNDLFIKDVFFINVGTESVGKKSDKVTLVDVSNAYSIGDDKMEMKGAGNGSELPDWAKGWTVGF